jgi:hypothetical protein
MTEPTDPPLTTLADAAFRQAAAKIVRRAIQTGTPLIVWDRDGVRSIPPDERSEGAQEILADAADLSDLRAAKSHEASAATVPLSEVKEGLGLGE